MITISLTLNVQLDATDLVAFDARLAALARGIGRFAESTETPQRPAEEPPGTPSVNLREPSALSANPVSPPTAPSAPRRPQTKARPPKMPARERTPVLGAIPAATMNGDGIHRIDAIDKSYPSHESPAPEVRPGAASYSIPFAEFDRLVRREMKRLAMDGRLPGHKLWDSERTPPLPTLGAVILRYQANGLVGLAETLGLEPPLSVQKKEEPTP